MTPATSHPHPDSLPDHAAAALDARLAELFDLRVHSGDARAEIEGFIGQCFDAAYGAKINQFMPRLFSLHSKRGELIAAFGLREAATSSLFLETYLEQPIERILESKTGTVVPRKSIIEVGNLSALYPGAARWLILALTVMLHRDGYQWVAFTGTAELRNGFSRLGLVPLDLGAATLHHLPPEQRPDWGSYYENAPQVMAGDIAHGYHSLLRQRDLAGLMRAGIDSVRTP